MQRDDPRTTNRSTAYAGTRVLVLGASGFVGRWVARALASQGAHVTLAVRNRRRAAALGHDLEFTAQLVDAHFTDAAAVDAVFAATRPAITFNLAAYCAHPGNDDEQEAERVNVSLTRWIADAATARRDDTWQGATLVHTGTAEEYGPVPGDLQEDTAPQPTTVYGRTKLAGTRAIQDLAARTQLRAVIARLFVVYGAGERPGRLVPSLIEAARTGAPLELSSGLQQRDFTYVEDVADGLLRLGLAAARPGEIVNLATGVARPVRSFVEAAAEALGLGAHQLNFGARPLHASDVSHADVDISRLRTLTGWSPGTTPADGVRRAAAWVHRMSAPVPSHD